VKTRVWTWPRMLLLTVAWVLGSGLGAQTQANDPVSLVERTASHIFTDVTENLEEYTANPKLLQTIVRNDLMNLA